MAKNQKSGISIKSIVIAVLCIALILFYFNYLSNRSSERKTQKQIDELAALSGYDMVNDYPRTPRDVVKMHCRFFKVFYGQSLTDDDLYILNQQIRYLYAEELLNYNSEDAMLKALKSNIEKTSKEKYKYKSYILPEASQVKTYTQNGKEMATMEVEVRVDTKDSGGYVYVQYVLVKENEQWKILAWGDYNIGGGQ
ncbi:MAG: ARC6/PARC6 family protein [Clostridium sp.]|nr:ARC6/PARC6 family protein [Clostridium sp.]MCM1172805.1 ARC6/PARC6 family protein [Clostridium sp.]MCM1209704.1 ARC6/PARC6 family protein [Ruminococcus sp.]